MYDIAIVGGGINGCGIARDAAGRGYSVVLAERDDLASGTSSGSTKLIHGGLRYLEHYEFRLVREALREREVLWAMAPHIIWPLRFVLPHTKGLRPAWLLRLGLFIYDHIGGRGRLPATTTLDLRKDPAGQPLQPGFSKAFEYSDCWVDDARLVVLNALDAANHGADIQTRTAVTRLDRKDDHWRVTMRDTSTARENTIEARMIINAAGPWVDQIVNQAAGSNQQSNIRLVQGSHIVVKQLFDHDRSYIFQNADDRVFFAIPYERDFTLIGTTDREYDGSPENVEISEGEINYLLTSTNEYFSRAITHDDIVWTFSAVRPLFDDGASKAQEATRDYVLKLDSADGEPKLLNVFGGKITTYRRLAEAAMDQVDQALARETAPWTSGSSLPGGEFDPTEFPQKLEELANDFPFLGQRTTERLLRTYGTRARDFLGQATDWSDLGEHFGADLTEHEVRYLQSSEWAEQAEDILWRRTKLGLHMSPNQRQRLSGWLAESSPENPA